MNAPGIETMGRVTAKLTLANNRDTVLAGEGLLPPDQVRRVQVRGLVDTGATRLVLPQAVITQLGLVSTGETRVRYADQRQGIRPVVSDVRVTLLGREGVFSALVEPDRADALIGAIVLEDLDLLVDCSRLTLYPRDPDMIVSEVE